MVAKGFFFLPSRPAIGGPDTNHEKQPVNKVQIHFINDSELKPLNLQ